MSFQIGPLSISSIAVLAPMAGITDLNFRILCKEQGCGLVYTELVSADCLLRGLRGSMRLVETHAAEQPVGVQLYDDDPARLAEAARWVEENIRCELIDLNMGCPVAKVVTRGAGAALMREPRRVETLVRAVTDAVALPVSAKTRSGWNDAEINAADVAKAVEQGGGQCIAIHARTRAQRHEGRVDWTLLAQVKNSVSIPVIGNGGLSDGPAAVRMREETGVDAVMVGRGAIGNPWIFREIDDAWHQRPVTRPSPMQKLSMMERHLGRSLETTRSWARKQKDRDRAEYGAVASIRGHLLFYVRGAPGADAFKLGLNELRSPGEALVAARKAFGFPAAAKLGSTS